MFILLDVLGWLVPIIIIIWIVRALSHRGSDKHTKGLLQTSFRDLMLALVAVAAGVAGLFTIFYLPKVIFGENTDNAVFAARLVLGVGLLLAGYLLKHITGIFLMIIGLLGLVFALPFVFDNLGSSGALVVAIIAFGVLVGFAVKISKRAEHHG